MRARVCVHAHAVWYGVEVKSQALPEGNCGRVGSGLLDHVGGTGKPRKNGQRGTEGAGEQASHSLGLKGH